jgi:hypothetical protein
MKRDNNLFTGSLRRLSASFFILLFSAASLFARGDSPRFGGGMGVLFQYASVQSDYGSLNGLGWGIGGRLHFYIGDHFRVGAMGSTWSLGYDNPGLKGSYYDLGYGGLTVEYGWRFFFSRISFGALFGGGGVTSLHVTSKDTDNNIIAVYKSYPTAIYSPMVTFEQSLTKQMALMVVAEFLIGNRLGDNQMLGYPGLRVGFIFNK